jgi:hypothetical protein
MFVVKMTGNCAKEIEEFAWSNDVKPLMNLRIIRATGEIQSRNLVNTKS